MARPDDGPGRTWESGRLVGGPGDGREVRMMRPPGRPWPQYVCHRPGVQPYGHYVHEGDDRYRYAGPCIEAVHNGPPPYEDRECCCGRPSCDGTGPYPEGGQ